MLKITIEARCHTVTIRTEGQLIGPWVDELEHCWQLVVNEPRPKQLTVDLSAVSFIDTAGRDLLSRIHQQGARLVARGMLTSHVVEHACSCKKRKDENTAESNNGSRNTTQRTQSPKGEIK